MANRVFVFVIVILLSGCSLKEIRSKTESGVEYRHSGGSRHEEQRYLVKQSLQFKWDKGVTTAVKYRRRDVNDGAGDHDDGIWFEVGFPLWKAPEKPDESSERIAALERRLRQLEKKLEGTP
ncbi:MAG: hypothetical protein MI923_12755 [Phycisphaerales bacterium]|nr:hypothetical protein [Phycisphaerales bacterium]